MDGDTGRALGKVVLFVVALKIAVVGFGLLGLPEGESWLGTYDRWDALHYRRIAAGGYGVAAGVSEEDRRFLAHFPPLYPMTIRATAALGFPLREASFVAAWAASLGMAALLWLLARAEAGSEAAAWSAVGLLHVYPAALVLVLPYSEPLFMLFVLGVFWFLRGRGGFVPACACAAGALFTRLLGVALLPMLVLEAARRWRGGAARAPLLAGLALTGLPGLAMLWINRRWYGDPFFFVHYMHGTEHAVKPGGWPLAEVVSNLAELWRFPSLVHDPGFMVHQGLPAFLVFFCWGVALATLRRLPWTYGCYALTYLALVSIMRQNIGLTRYSLALLPMFLALGRLEDRRWTLAVALPWGAGLLYYVHWFVRGTYCP